MPPAWDWEPMHPVGLDPEARYAASVLDVGGQQFESRGEALMTDDGILLPEGSMSTLVLLQRGA